jgi:hypothetical protein
VYQMTLLSFSPSSNRLVVVLLEQLVAKLDVLGLGVLLAQASVDLILPLVVLCLALYFVSSRPSIRIRHA